MKVRITFKTPDVVQEGFDDALKESLKETPGLSADEREGLEGLRASEIGPKVAKWFRYGEYVDVEVDTEADTCVVVPPR